MEIKLAANFAAQVPPVDIWRFFWPGVGVAVAIIFLVGGLIQLRSWFWGDDGAGTETHEMLSQYRQLHENGELTDEEYRLIKNRLIGKKQPAPAVSSNPVTVEARPESFDRKQQPQPNSSMEGLPESAAANDLPSMPGK